MFYRDIVNIGSVTWNITNIVNMNGIEVFEITSYALTLAKIWIKISLHLKFMVNILIFKVKMVALGL